MSQVTEIDDEFLYRHVGEFVRRRRIAAGLTQAELAERAKVLRTSIANIEAGRQKAPLHVLYKLCVSLGVEARWMLPTNAEVTRMETVAMPLDGVVKQVPPKTAELLERLLRERE